MEWLKNFIKNNPLHALIIPTGVGGFSFLASLMEALSAGSITITQLQELIRSANGIEFLLLVLVMYLMRKGKKK